MTGIVATTDVGAALAAESEAVCSTATGDLRPVEAIDGICRASWTTWG